MQTQTQTLTEGWQEQCRHRHRLLQRVDKSNADTDTDSYRGLTRAVQTQTLTEGWQEQCRHRLLQRVDKSSADTDSYRGLTRPVQTHSYRGLTRPVQTHSYRGLSRPVQTQTHTLREGWQDQCRHRHTLLQREASPAGWVSLAASQQTVGQVAGARQRCETLQLSVFLPSVVSQG